MEETLFVIQGVAISGAEIILMMIGAVIGAVVSIGVQYTINLCKESLKKLSVAKRKKKILEEFKKFNCSNLNGYLPIDHAIPKYVKKDICLKQYQVNGVAGTLYIGTPGEEYLERLNDMEFILHENSNNIWDNTEICAVFRMLAIENPDDVISNAANCVASGLIQDMDAGKIRFNGQMFGIKNLRINRDCVNEKAELILEFYTTDFFTYRVFAEIYKNHKDKFTVNNIVDLNRIPQFMSSFGIACFIIGHYNGIDSILLAHRSENVLVDAGKIHFSMNEAFTQKDRDIDGNLSFESCLFRGLTEELGIPEDYRPYIKQNYGFLDLGVEMNRLEVGISCYTRIIFDNQFTPEMLLEFYSIAQDAELETSRLVLVPLEELDKYLQENNDKMSVGCSATLKLLRTRIKTHYTEIMTF